MGPPRLASLVLLLLALCRPVFSSVTWSSVNTAISTSSVSYMKKEEADKAKTEMIKPTGGNLEELLGLVGNTVVMLGFVKAGISDKMPMYIQEAFFNGLLCEFDQADLNKKLVHALYGQDSVPDKARRQEEEFFKNTKGVTVPIDCANQKSPPSEPEKCFCAEKNTMFYCFMLIMKSGPQAKPKKTCRPDALTALNTASPELFKLYDIESSKNSELSNAAHSGNVGGVTQNENTEIGKLFCEARKDTVKSALVTLYAADAMYWMTEAALMTILFGEATRDMSTACSQKTYMENPYGKCVCEQNTGFSFCIYRALGDFFVEKGYLKCDGGAASYDKDKKPDSLPQLTPSSSNSSSSSSSSSSSPAADTSGLLLLLPAAAAAAMLLQGY